MTNRFNPWNFITEAILNQGYIFIECSLHCVEGFLLNAKKKELWVVMWRGQTWCINRHKCKNVISVLPIKNDKRITRLSPEMFFYKV